MNHYPVDLALLKTFTTIIRCGGFLTAAEVLGRSPSAISMQIKRLEADLDCTLFRRNARETVLTREGEKLLGHAQPMLEMEALMRRDFGDGDIRGEVVLGVPDDVIERFPMHVLQRFGELYPAVSISITVGHTPAMIAAVEKEELDIAIVTHADSIPGIGKAELIHREPRVWVGLKGGQARYRQPLPLTLWETGWAWYKPTIEILEEAGIAYRTVLHSENITARKNAILADLAVGPLPKSRLDDRLEPVTELQALPDLPSYGLGLMLRSKPSDAMEALGEFMRQNFSRGLASVE